MCMFPGEVLPRICIARAAANESVSEDLIVCKCKVSSSVYTIAEVIWKSSQLLVIQPT